MPIASTLSYLKSLLNGIAMPGGLPNMACYITPPDPNVEANIPTSYVWDADFDESRNPDQGGTIPRNTGPGTASGFKAIEHSLEVFIVFFQANDAPDADSLFPGIVDAVMFTLRTSLDPSDVLTDPYTGQQSTLYDVGEIQRGRITISATANQAYDRYDSLITLTLHELIQA